MKKRLIILRRNRAPQIYVTSIIDFNYFLVESTLAESTFTESTFTESTFTESTFTESAAGALVSPELQAAKAPRAITNINFFMLKVFE